MILRERVWLQGGGFYLFKIIAPFATRLFPTSSQSSPPWSPPKDNCPILNKAFCNIIPHHVGELPNRKGWVWSNVLCRQHPQPKVPVFSRVCLCVTLCCGVRVFLCVYVSCLSTCVGVSVCSCVHCAVCPTPPQPSTLLRSTSGCPVGEKSHDLFWLSTIPAKHTITLDLDGTSCYVVAKLLIKAVLQNAANLMSKG